ncbi:MAG: hypothetical protein ABIH65_00395 [Nanoarchaeota archaeon]
MTIEEVVKRTTIEFPQKISFSQVEDLIKHIAKELPANIHYDFLSHTDVGYSFGTEELVKNTLKSPVTGRIIKVKEPLIFGSFSFINSKQDIFSSSSMQFHLGHDWELEKYSPKVRKLWDDVKKIVDEYFEIQNYGTW